MNACDSNCRVRRTEAEQRSHNALSSLAHFDKNKNKWEDLLVVKNIPFLIS